MHITLANLGSELRADITARIAKAADIAEIFAKKAVQKNFDDEGRPAWKPAKKKRRSPRAKTLTQSSALRQIQTAKTISGSTATITLAPGMRARAYARIHQEGGTITRSARPMRFRSKPKTSSNHSARLIFAGAKHKKTITKIAKAHTITIPARPFLTIPAEDINAIINEIQNKI